MTEAGRWEAFGLAHHRPIATVVGAPRSVAEILNGPVRRHPARTALVGRYARYTYAELDEMANRAAHGLQHLGITTGDRVAACLPNHPDIVVAFLGAMRLGAIWVGINRGLASTEKLALLADADASLLLADRETLDTLGAVSQPAWRRRRVEVGADERTREWEQLLATSSTTRPRIEVDPFAPAAIAYTSGTTGQPKGVVHSQHNLIVVGAVNRVTGGWRAVPCQAAVLALTILNVMTLGPLLVFQLDGTCVCVEHHDPATLARWIREERVQSFSAVPTIVHDLVASPVVTRDDLASLGSIGAGGMSLPDALRSAYRDRFGKAVLGSYGLTEAPTMITVQEPGDVMPRGSSGTVRPHLEVTIRDDAGRALPHGQVGEICVSPASRGPLAGVYTPFLGYWRRPAETRRALRDLTLHTGDLGSLSEDGTIFVRGRGDDLIIRGGVNVYPIEIERILEREARVAAAVVVGRVDERLGERIIAFAEPVPGATVTPEELRQYCRASLARSKVPDEVVIIEQFARNAMGKILKGSLDLGSR